MNRVMSAALAALLASSGWGCATAQNPGDDSAPPPVLDRDSDEDRGAAPYTVTRIPGGTEIPVTLDEDVPVTRDNIGDRFEGHITRDVEVNGAVLLVRGAPVELRLVESDEGSGAATLRLDRLHVNGDMRSVESSDAQVDTEERGLSTAEKTAVGAGAGAIVGAVTGAGVLEGAIVGAGGGLAWGLLDGEGARQVDDDTPLRFTLQESVELD